MDPKSQTLRGTRGRENDAPLKRANQVTLKLSRGNRLLASDSTAATSSGVSPSSQSTRPVWDATPTCGDFRRRCAVSIHASRVGRDPDSEIGVKMLQVSIHASRVGRDQHQQSPRHGRGSFNPRVPCGTRLAGHRSPNTAAPVSIHASRVGRDSKHRPRTAVRIVSIHASRVGRDLTCHLLDDRNRLVSIHASRVGRDKLSVSKIPGIFGFNPRVPCGTRRAAISHVGSLSDVSIHASRVGRDVATTVAVETSPLFQSTRPVWDATDRPLQPSNAPYVSIHASRVGRDGLLRRRQRRGVAVSIHASRVGRDERICSVGGRRASFNPRVPCGTRLHRLPCLLQRQAFQSTRPVWDATNNVQTPSNSFSCFNPRVPCGTRLLFALAMPRGSGFNPRVPCGTRPDATDVLTHWMPFQSTRPVWDATRLVRPLSYECARFNPRVPCGTRPTRAANASVFPGVSIHASRVGRDSTPVKNRKAPPKFQSTRPVWDATIRTKFNAVIAKFQSTRPVWDATTRHPSTATNTPCFNPRVPCGTRLRRKVRPKCPAPFQSTRPVWDATPLHLIDSADLKRFNPRVPCGTRRPL